MTVTANPGSHAPRTRRRGEAKTRVALLAKVDPAIKAKVERVADEMGISQAAAVEWMLDSVAVDANGRPGAYAGPMTSETDEELPLIASA